jgi:CheY-like chemotaxis protein
MVDAACRKKPGTFYYEGVSSIPEARSRLETDYYHLVILDNNFQTTNILDEQGIQFLEWLYRQYIVLKNKHQYHPLHVVMLTSKYNNEALTKALNRFDVLEFYDKDEEFDIHTFAGKLAQLLDSNLRFNPSLTIDWQSDPAFVINLLQKAEQAIQLDNPVAELEDFMCRLYTDTPAIRVALKSNIPTESSVFLLEVSGDNLPASDYVVVEMVSLNRHQEGTVIPDVIQQQGQKRLAAAATLHYRGKRYQRPQTT